MKKLITLFAFVFTMSAATMAQVQLKTSPFKHLPVPQKSGLFKAVLNNKIVAYRFVLPFAGYSPITKQISTGLGYGWNKMHFVDSTQKYYTDLSIFAAIFVNGDLVPTPYNFTSFGVGIGMLNNLITIVPAYNLPNSNNKGGAFDLKISFGVPLN